MAPRTRKAAKLAHESSNEFLKKTHRTLADLPPELMCMILDEAKQSRYTLWACANTCRALREVAVEYLPFQSPCVQNWDHFISFMRRHQRLFKNVQNLRLSGPDVRLDAALVSEAAQLFPNLVALALTDVSCDPAYMSDPNPPQTQAEADPNSEEPSQPPVPPMRLKVLRLTCTRRARWSLCGMMHLISQFSPRELFLRVDDDVGRLTDSFDAGCLVAAPAVEKLILLINGSQKSMPKVLAALSMTLAPDALRSVDIKSYTKPSLSALGPLFDRVGGNVRKLEVSPEPPFRGSDRDNWSDSFDDWQLLDIRGCKKLESISLHIYVKPREQIKSHKALGTVGAGILAHYASPTLQRIILEVHDLARPTTLGNRAVLKLQECDKVVTQERFPNLQRFDLRVGVVPALERKTWFSQKCSAAALRALPGLHGRGVLHVSIQRQWRW